MHVHHKTEKYVASVPTVFNSVEELLGVQDATPLANLDDAAIVKYVSALRSPEVFEATVGAYCGTLKGALGWALRAGLIRREPAFPPLPKGGSRPRARAVKTEEFERMLDAVSGFVGTTSSCNTRWTSVGPPAF